MCPNYVFLDALSIGNILDWKRWPTKIITLLPRPYRSKYFTLPWSESSKNMENGITLLENLLWSRFCASLGSRLIELPLRGVGLAHQKSALLVRSPVSNKKCVPTTFSWTLFWLATFLIENGDLLKSSLCFPVRIEVSIWLCLGQNQRKTWKIKSACKKPTME